MIKVGDLALIVRARRCCGGGGIGNVIRVVHINHLGISTCHNCGALFFDEREAQAAEGDWIEVARLKRIPPLEELDDVKQDEEIHA